MDNAFPLPMGSLRFRQEIYCEGMNRPQTRSRRDEIANKS